MKTMKEALRFSDNHLPCLCQSLHIPGRIGRTGGRQTHRHHSGFRKNIFLIEFKRCLAIDKYLPDRCFRENPANIIRHNILNTAVAGADNITTGDYIPQGNLMLQQKLFLLFHIF